MDAGETATDNLGNLLDTALEPAIDAHLVQVRALLGRGDEAIAVDTFFDLQIADLAMGSAHFRVAAIDRIEAKFTAFLTEKQIPAVGDELTRLSQAAQAALGEHALNVEIETADRPGRHPPDLLDCHPPGMAGHCSGALTDPFGARRGYLTFQKAGRRRIRLLEPV